MTQVIQSFYREFKDILYPNNCAICNRMVEQYDNLNCNRCVVRFTPTWLDDWIDKLRFSEGIDEVYSAWYATGVINDIIHNVKYHNRPRLGEELDHRLAEEIPIKELDDIDLITAVPLNSTKGIERGYNQAEWICKGLSKVWNVLYKSNLIKRIKYTSTQTDLSANDCKENVENAFSSSIKLDSISIAIIDDVITTGTTMSECAVELKEYRNRKNYRRFVLYTGFWALVRRI